MSLNLLGLVKTSGIVERGRDILTHTEYCGVCVFTHTRTYVPASVYLPAILLTHHHGLGCIVNE